MRVVLTMQRPAGGVSHVVRGRGVGGEVGAEGAAGAGGGGRGGRRRAGARGVSDRLVRLLGLGARGGGGRVVIGVSGVRAQLQRDGLSCVVLAADASPRTREKVERLARARRVPVLMGPVAERLGAGVGRVPRWRVGWSGLWRSE